MAEGGERTETATQRRLDKAREAGQVPLSREVLGVAVLGSAGLVLAMVAPRVLGDAARALAVIVEQADRLTPGQVQAAKDLRAAGRSVKEIGQLLGNGNPVSRQTVYRALGMLAT